MSRRKDRERFLQLRQESPDYTGFRGMAGMFAAPAKAAEATVSLACSVCRRKRNVPEGSLPEDRDTYVCLNCQEKAAKTGRASYARQDR